MTPSSTLRALRPVLPGARVVLPPFTLLYEPPSLGLCGVFCAVVVFFASEALLLLFLLPSERPTSAELVLLILGFRRRADAVAPLRRVGPLRAAVYRDGRDGAAPGRRRRMAEQFGNK